MQEFAPAAYSKKQQIRRLPQKKKSLIANADSVVIKPSIAEIPIYTASETRINDLIHTKLDVKFDWVNARMMGKATITAKPYFYPSSQLELDAKGFDIHEVSLVKGENRQKLNYDYKNSILSIKLDRSYTRDESYTVFIDYTAKPNELKNTGSEAIKGDKGLYFINPNGKEKNKPQQIWTQGETEDNSGWFPTIDKPNEKMTNEICITVEKRFTTLSNGELAFSTENADTTRTDCWKMDLPHSSYLMMMAIGEYAVVKDKWKDKEVNYYVEKEYEPYARAIFGNTPEMMDFFSNRLSVSYPWNKYAQVIVRDYVSGAMENTTATVHGETLNRTDRELLDRNTYEDVIAHELFHHWFGDLVTCESWSNLPLNESFATYGEYLWNEYKYGSDKADEGLADDMDAYLYEASNKKKDLIRFNYEDREDMFDRHTYQKGGRILHMLRKYVGEEAFFASLKLYLENNKFKNAEIHQLRLAFEEVTGEDLNWFFNQWFLASGHPELEIKHIYNDAEKKYNLIISQIQDRDKTPLYKLPMKVDIYLNGTKQRHTIVMTKSIQEFIFDVPSKPDLVNVDAEKMLLCKKKEEKSQKEWAFQYFNGPLYLDRMEALDNFSTKETDSLAKTVFVAALNDKYYGIRDEAVRFFTKIKEERVRETLKNLALKDEKSTVRAGSIAALSRNFEGEDLMEVYRKGMKDRSYAVLRQSMSAIARINKEEGLSLAKQYEAEEKGGLLFTIADIYSQYGNDENNSFFLNAAGKTKGLERLGFINLYLNFLKRSKDETINEALPLFEKLAREKENKWGSVYAKKAMEELMKIYGDRWERVQQKMNDLKSVDPNATGISGMELEIEKAKAQEKKIKDMLEGLK